MRDACSHYRIVPRYAVQNVRPTHLDTEAMRGVTSEADASALVGPSLATTLLVFLDKVRPTGGGISVVVLGAGSHAVLAAHVDGTSPWICLRSPRSPSTAGEHTVREAHARSLRRLVASQGGRVLAGGCQRFFRGSAGHRVDCFSQRNLDF
jgi:hypothetical protein